PASDPRETFELEDSGISDVVLKGEEDQTPFDLEPAYLLPRLGDLPAEARPRVLFWIDSQFQVHRLERGKRGASAAQEAVALAIALHLRNLSTVRLSVAGDWQWLPAIGRIVPAKTKYHTELVELVPEAFRDEIRSRLKGDKGFLHSFALVLPSGDVITPAALVHPAQQGKQATRAAALVWCSQKPAQLAGEDWTSEDWKKFDDAQKGATKRATTGTTPRKKGGAKR
ncbi:MAG: hypothetical protein WBL65_20140, partial [Bryobacteraceae bacterium]